MEVIEHAVVAEKDEWGIAIDIPTVLRYDGMDPFAVTISFVPEGHEAVDWVVSRELMEEGLDHMVGSGDIAFWPMDSKTRLVVNLDSPDGEAIMTLKAKDVRSFLDETYDMVSKELADEFAGHAIDQWLEGEIL